MGDIRLKSFRMKIDPNPQRKRTLMCVPVDKDVLDNINRDFDMQLYLSLTYEQLLQYQEKATEVVIKLIKRNDFADVPQFVDAETFEVTYGKKQDYPFTVLLLWL